MSVFQALGKVCATLGLLGGLWAGAGKVFASASTGTSLGAAKGQPESSSLAPAWPVVIPLHGAGDTSGVALWRYVGEPQRPRQAGAQGYGRRPAPKAPDRQPAFLILPGGAYAFVAMASEGGPVAQWVTGLGLRAFVLNYSTLATQANPPGAKSGTGSGGAGSASGPGQTVLPPLFPKPLEEAKRALRLMRLRAREWGIDTARIGLIGFSAGGHLAATVASQADDGDPRAADPLERMSCRPQALVLGYPVVSMRRGITHAGSRLHLLGPNPDSTLVARLSQDEQDAGTLAAWPPVFLFHSRDDDIVPFANAERLAAACRKSKVPLRFMAFAGGKHAYGLGQGREEVGAWPEACARWLREQGWAK